METNELLCKILDAIDRQAELFSAPSKETASASSFAFYSGMQTGFRMAKTAIRETYMEAQGDNYD